MILDPLPFLAASQSDEGGWGYQPGHVPVVEATGAVLLALSQERQDQEIYQRACSWLAAIQHEDGGWGMGQADELSGWMTAWAVWALGESRQFETAARAGMRWLEQVPVLQISNLDDLALGERLAGINFALRGWSWQPGEASWVEPTALAGLAFASLGNTESRRLAESIRYLENRRCPGGGWNVGNPIMFGSYLPARAQPTALSLVALSRLAPETILDEDIEVLKDEALKEDSAMALGWGALALAECGKPSGELLAQLSRKQKDNGSWDDNLYVTAIAWRALQKAWS